MLNPRSDTAGALDPTTKPRATSATLCLNHQSTLDFRVIPRINTSTYLLLRSPRYTQTPTRNALALELEKQGQKHNWDRNTSIATPPSNLILTPVDPLLSPSTLESPRLSSIRIDPTSRSPPFGHCAAVRIRNPPRALIDHIHIIQPLPPIHQLNLSHVVERHRPTSVHQHPKFKQ